MLIVRNYICAWLSGGAGGRPRAAGRGTVAQAGWELGVGAELQHRWRTPKPGAPGSVGRLLLSVAGHGAVVAALAGHWTFVAKPPPPEVAAVVEVMFGKNADRPATASAPPVPANPGASPAVAAPAGAASLPDFGEGPEPRTEATLDQVPMPPAPSAAPVAAEADVRVADGGEVGLDFKRGEEGVVEAASDPGNRAPRYPEAAVARHEYGLVVWRMFIDSDGRIDHVAAVQSSSFRDLDDAARVAFLRWHYRPARRDGVAVASTRDLTANFVLGAP